MNVLSIWKYCTDLCVTSLKDKYNVEITIISPFGFEVLEDRSFREKKFNRYYLYVGFRNNFDLSYIEKIVFAEFLEILEKYMIKIHNELAIVALRSGAHHILNDKIKFSESDLCIVIEGRQLIDKTLIRDYADYILCSTNAILNGELKESKSILNFKESRARIYQLYIILCHLYGIDNSSIFDILKEYIAINKKDNLKYYYSSKIIKLPTKVEKRLLQRIYKDLNEIKMINLTNPTDLLYLRVKSYHGDNILECKINKVVYSEMLNKIRQSYDRFWN